MSTIDPEENMKYDSMDQESLFNIIIHEDNINTNKAHIVFAVQIKNLDEQIFINK